jgi:hypothetical protein
MATVGPHSHGMHRLTWAWQEGPDCRLAAIAAMADGLPSSAHQQRQTSLVAANCSLSASSVQIMTVLQHALSKGLSILSDLTLSQNGQLSISRYNYSMG